MRTGKLLLLALASLFIACADAPDPSVTAPDASLRFAKPIGGGGGSCDAGVNRTVKSQMSDLFAKPQIDAANLLWAAVESACGNNLSAARESMLAYVQFTIDNKGSIKPPRRNAPPWQQALLTHWNATFTYVGYTGEDGPSSLPVEVFGAEGGVGVIPANIGPLGHEVAAANAALTMFQQDANGDPRGHLFAIYPLPDDCLGQSSLSRNGPCFEFASFPAVAGQWSPKAKVGICQVNDPDDHIGNHLRKPAIAHLEDNSPRITDLTGPYPTFCGDVASIPAGSWTGGVFDFAKRLAWTAKRTFAPQPLFAVHGGLGGLGGKFSPHQAVDLLVFDATFDNDVAGQFPAQPAVGSFTAASFATAPGSILVQTSLGQRNSPLVVLTQAGGNCANCGGLLLEGRLATESPGTYATEGVYEAQWISLQAGPTMKSAAFVLRGSDGSEIAKVVYSTASNVNKITFNDSNTTLANWVRSVPQHFRIRVDLDNKTTTLWINNSEKAQGTFAATNFATISADFRGIDSGVMGWDELMVERMPGS